MRLASNPRLVAAVNEFLTEFQFHIGGFLGFVTLTCLFTMIFHITCLGVSGVRGNSDQARADALKGILISGVGLAVLGSLSVWFLLFTGIMSG